MRYTIVALVLLGIIIIFANEVRGKRIEGTLSGVENWKYLTRFCFLSGTGSLQFYFRYPKSYKTESLLLYWDKPDMWKNAYSNKTMTCQQKEDLLDINKYQIIRLNTSNIICSIETNNTIVCFTEKLRFQTARERWWFLAISNCESMFGVYLKYDVTMRNGDHGEFFKEHFSADELYILEFNIAAFFVELVMAILVIVVSVKLANMQMFHSTYKIFLSSVTFFFASIIVTCIAYMTYASSGYENTGLKHFGTALYAMSQILFVLMLLLLSLGYTVVCGRLPHWGVIWLSVFMTSFTFAYIALYIVEAVTFDAALVLYRYESSPGYGLMAVILASWLFYLSCCIFTMSKHKKKVAFYAPMLTFYSFWFIAIPITVAVNITQVPDYMRAKVVNFIEVISLFLAHVFYLVLTWPSLANKNFPFHIKTTQIDVVTFAAAMADKENDEDNKDSADLPDGRQFTDFSIFTVPDQRSNFTPTATNGFGRGGGGGGGSGDNDWDSGVNLSTPVAADADSEAASQAGSVSGAACLVESGVRGFNFNSYDNEVDGENTGDQPPGTVAAAALSSDDRQEYDNFRSETASLQEPPMPPPDDASVEGGNDEPVAEVSTPEWMRSGPLGGGGARGGSRGLLPPI